MKQFALALLVSTFALTASAVRGNDGPNAAPIAPPGPVIARVSYGVVFAPASVPSIVVTIGRAGQVEATEYYRDGKKITHKLANLSPEALAKVQALVNSTVAGELVDFNPNEPGCMDAPTTTYTVIKDSGEIIDVSQTMQCKDFYRAEPQSSDYTLKSVLEGLLQVAHLF